MNLKHELNELDTALTDALNSGDPPDLRLVWKVLLKLRVAVRTLATMFP